MTDTTPNKDSGENDPKEFADGDGPATESAEGDAYGSYEAQNFGEPDSSKSGG